MGTTYTLKTYDADVSIKSDLDNRIQIKEDYIISSTQV